MIATGTTASGSVWSAARRLWLPDDASSRARPSPAKGRDEAMESLPPTDIQLRRDAEKAGGGAVGVTP